MYVSTVRQMRNLDHRATEEYGIPDELLMENAGHAVYYAMLERRVVDGGRFLVVSGPGNNGGDGFVVARKLHTAGARVRVAIMADRAAYTGPSLTNLSRLAKGEVQLLDQPGPERLAENLAWADVVVDALLGTGLTRDVDGPFAGIVRSINEAAATIFSVDIPSGVEGDNGRIRGCAVEADATITFGLPKLGNVLEPGATVGGRLYVSPISFPPALISSAGFRVALNEPVAIPRVRALSNPTVHSTPRPDVRGAEAGTKQSLLIFETVDLSSSTGWTLARIEADPITPVRELAGELGTPLVVQGPRALIGLPDGRVFINPVGGSLWAVAGRDETIRQAVDNMFTLGLSPEDALLTGVFAEGVAADLAAHSRATTTTLTARNIAAHLPHAIQMLEGGRRGASLDHHGALRVI
ncbi:MAG: NAD(P)H-hydrate epimerase [Gemmatimonadota bacterium]